MYPFIALLEINSDNYIDILKENEELFSQFGIVGMFFRQVGWLILKGMMSLLNMLYALVDNVFEILNFMNNKELNAFMGTLDFLVYIILMFAIVYLGFCYIVAHEKPKGVVTNMMLFAFAVLFLPYLMVQMTKLTEYGKDLIQADFEKSGGYDLLRPYVTDLLYLDSIDFDKNKMAKGSINGYTTENAENMKYLDINEVMDPGDYELENEKLFKRQLTSEIEKGKEVLKVTKIKKDKFFFQDKTPYYYRYHFNFLITFLYLFGLIGALCFSAYKMTQIILELCFEKVMAPFFAAGDITNGQKVRKMLTSIISGYACLMIMLFLQRFYVLFTAWVNAKEWSDSAAANGFTKAFIMICGFFFLIDGPNIIEQILGIDAGLKSVAQTLQSAYYASQMAGGAARAVKGGLGKVSGMAKGAARTSAGSAAAFAGMMEGLRASGAIASNNEKVSGEMARNPDKAGSSSEANGNAQSEMKDAVSAEAHKEQMNADTARENSPAAEKTAGASDSGQGAQDVNGQINDAVNKNRANQPEMRQNAIANWAMKNTKGGQHIGGSMQKGRELGEAVGNTLYNLRQLRESRRNPETEAKAPESRNIHFEGADKTPTGIEKSEE